MFKGRKRLPLLLLFVVFASLALSVYLLSPKKIKAAILPGDTEGAICMGEAMAEWLDQFYQGIDNRGVTSEIKLLSPAFNLTSSVEPLIAQAMLDSGANFNRLWGFAGNTYRIPSDGSGNSPWKYVSDNGWLSIMTRNIVFTEYGILDNAYSVGGTRPDIGQMRSDYDEAATKGTVSGILYFNPQNKNTDWARHELTAAEFNAITLNNPSKAGSNSATQIYEAFPGEAKGYSSNVNWVLGIVYGTGDLENAIKFSNNAIALNLKPVIRICSGNTCPFKDPLLYAQFVKDLDDGVFGDVYVIAGPNEPASEPWVAPECASAEIEREYILPPEPIPCDQRYVEFHSLRPYPVSPCSDDLEPAAIMCANTLLAKETFEVSINDAVFPDGTRGGVAACTQDASGAYTCNFRVESTLRLEADLDEAEFPILGNTELVPNYESANEGGLDFLQRVNEYVSWYLNGVTFRAEEMDEALTESNGTPRADYYERLYEIINLSGPLKKLLPIKIQEDARGLQKLTIGTLRHDQIVLCTAVASASPVMCYRGSGWTVHDLSGTPQYLSRIGLASHIPTRYYPFIPFTSTEDRKQFALSTRFDPQVMGDVTITNRVYTPDSETEPLYFAHTEEVNGLSQMLQRMFLPIQHRNEDVGIRPTDVVPESANIVWPGCKVIEARKNPGDDLYAEYNLPGENRIGGTLTYQADFSCTFGSPTGPGSCSDACQPADACVAAGGTIVGRPCSFDYCETGTVPCATTSTDTTCQKIAMNGLELQVKTPLVDDIFDRLVAGSMSFVRRIFPKTGPNTPIETIKDLPGESNASYASRNSSFEGGALVGEETVAGGPSDTKAGSGASIYFNHLGSIYDYFLQDVQEALRPKGLGNAEMELPQTDAICSIEGTPIQSQLLLNIIAEAARWAHVPVDVLVTAVRAEGCGGGGRTGGICAYDDETVAQYSAPGKEDPRNCPTGGYNMDGRNKGPMQFFHNNVVWTPWSNAINLARGESRSTNPCNLADAIFAAAYLLSDAYDGCGNGGYNVANTPPASSWTIDKKKLVLTAWATGCTTTACQASNPAYQWAAEAYCQFYDMFGASVTSDCD